jgi:hypothetical protein
MAGVEGATHMLARRRMEPVHRRSLQRHRRVKCDGAPRRRGARCHKRLPIDAAAAHMRALAACWTESSDPTAVLSTDALLRSDRSPITRIAELEALVERARRKAGE